MTRQFREAMAQHVNPFQTAIAPQASHPRRTGPTSFRLSRIATPAAPPKAKRARPGQRDLLLKQWTKRLSLEDKVKDARARLTTMQTRGWARGKPATWRERKALALLAVASSDDRERIFSDLSRQLIWKPSHREGVWRTTMGTMQALEIQITRFDNDVAAKLRHGARQQAVLPVRVGGVLQQVDCSAADIQAMMTTATLRTSIVLSVAWRLGQRTGDVAMLVVEGLARVVFGGTECLSITFFRTKVNKQAYALHLPIDTPEAKMIMWAADHAVGRFQRLFPEVPGDSSMATPLFLVDWSEQQRDLHAEKLRNEMRVTRPHMFARMIRRGGLQTLASSGCPPEMLLHFSRHSSMENLMRYLGGGRWLAAAAATIQELIARTPKIVLTADMQRKMNDPNPMLT